MTVTWEQIKEGDVLPDLIKKPGVTDLVIYSAGGGDFNPLHHDINSPMTKRIGNVVVHGKYKWASMGELVSNWLAHNGQIKRLSCRYAGMDFAGKQITCKGKVGLKYEEDGKKIADVDVWTENEDKAITTTGKAVIVFK